MTNPALPSPDVLFGMSKTSLQDLLLAGWDRSSRHLKAARISWDEAVREQAIVLLAEYLLEYREAFLDQARRTIEPQSVLEFPQARKRA